ncbi:MAG: PEP-CTERM sorting domain-containing protein [Chthonomonadaceae bacterium]|nr:PEP-CTERM sorting domain-containing protein [Chthonomonadaceae bacterium]
MVRTIYCAVLCCACFSFLFAQRYHLTDIGTGNGLRSPIGNSVNESGAVAGVEVTKGFFWDESAGMTTVNFGLSEVQVNEVNDLGTVVGWGFPDDGRRSFVWDKQNGARSIGVAEGSVGNEAAAINNLGQVAARSFMSGMPNRASLYDPLHGWSILGALDPTRSSIATDLNNSSQVTGISYIWDGQRNVEHTFLWTEANGMVDIGLPTNRHGILGSAISDAGVIVGYMDLFNFARHSFYRTPDGVITELIPFQGGSEDNLAWDVNSQMQIVGNIGVQGGPDPSGGYVWDPVQGMRNLNTSMDASGAGYWVFGAYGINDRGQICGGAIKNGQIRAVRLDPIVPEPSTLTIAGLGILVAAFRRKRSPKA